MNTSSDRIQRPKSNVGDDVVISESGKVDADGFLSSKGGMVGNVVIGGEENAVPIVVSNGEKEGVWKIKSNQSQPGLPSERPQNGQIVHILYGVKVLGKQNNVENVKLNKEQCNKRFYEENDQFLDSNFDDINSPFLFVIGDNQVIEGVEWAVKSMKIGEKSIFRISPKYGYGKYPPLTLSSIPANATLIYEIHLLNISEGKLVKKDWDLSDEEKISSASSLKEDGNYLFKESKFVKAKKKYKLALKTFEDIILEGQQLEGDVKSTTLDATQKNQNSPDYSKMDKNSTKYRIHIDVKLPCFLNIAACNLKLGQNKGAIVHCGKALMIDPHNIKGLYRRGQAYLGLEEFEKAKQDFYAALKQCESTKEDIKTERLINSLLQKTIQQESAYQKKLKKMYAGMFSSK